MNYMFKSVAAAMALSFAVSAGAGEVLVTPMATDNGTVALAFDISSTGGVAGFNFKVNVPSLSDQSGKLQNCVAELPKGFDGACSVTKGGVYVYATSRSPDVTLPAGVVSVGTVTISHSNAAKVGSGDMKMSVSELAMFDSNAQAVSASAKISPASK